MDRIAGANTAEQKHGCVLSFGPQRAGIPLPQNRR